MTNSAFSASEAAHLSEPDRCERCGGPDPQPWLCARCDDDEADAAEQDAQEREERARFREVWNR